MEISEVKRVLEALLFVSERPLLLKELKSLLSDDYSDLDNIENILNELKTEYENADKPYEIRFVAEGWTFATKTQYSPWLKKLFKKKFIFKLSPSALETLAIVAYKQPTTRADIDDIRGVDSSGVLDTLLERKLIKITGRKEALGYPLLYATTQEFMKHFGLSHITDLPSIENNPDLEIEENPEDVPELPFEEKKMQKKEAEKEEEEKEKDEEVAEEQQ
ncbi:MAG: SMC-Scp complex subunit ScpB [Elusimicrobiota bacterium]|jgi:segregation and condensation protein B|nr:SMC-Scp complex subunit ScpB [Elusimicrobiota bacterium]